MGGPHSTCLFLQAMEQTSHSCGVQSAPFNRLAVLFHHAKRTRPLVLRVGWSRGAGGSGSAAVIIIGVVLNIISYCRSSSRSSRNCFLGLGQRCHKLAFSLSLPTCWRCSRKQSALRVRYREGTEKAGAEDVICEARSAVQAWRLAVRHRVMWQRAHRGKKSCGCCYPTLHLATSTTRLKPRADMLRAHERESVCVCGAVPESTTSEGPGGQHGD